MTVDIFIRVVLPTFFTLVAAFYAARLTAGRKRGGVSLSDPDGGGETQRRTHAMFKVFRILIWAVVTARAIAPPLDPWFGSFTVPGPAWVHPTVGLVGVALMVAGFARVIYVHVYMGDAWRSGVPRDGPVALLVTGPFSSCRHPMYAAIMVAQLGLAMAWPSMFTLGCLAVGVSALVAQARVEEDAMHDRYSGTWEDYRAGTGAFLPKIGGPPPRSGFAA